MKTRYKSWSSYESFDSETGFSGRAGFQLSKGQVELVELLLTYPKNLNKAEVGCGKTVMSTVTSLMLGYDVTIVTVPPILVVPWVEWLNQVSEGVVEYRGDPRERAAMRPGLRQARWIVCSHAIYRDDFGHLCQAVAGRFYEVVVDEAHWIKNPKSVLFKKVQTLCAGDVGLAMLTGTPVNKPMDSYSYVKLKDPDIYRSLVHFEAIHVAKRDFFKKPIAYANLDLLATNLNLKSVSATKEAMHGYTLKPLLPNCEYDLHPEHQRLYQKLVDEQLLTFDDGSLIDASTPQRLQHALQQAIVHFDYFANDPTKRSAAYDLLDQTIEEIEVDQLGKSKLIVWTKYKRTSAALLEYCNTKLKIKTVAAYSGADSSKSAQMFMHEEDTRILVAQPQSAGAGLNPQAVCWESLYMEIDTVPLYARQSFGRINRVGQKHVPRIKIGRARNTVQMYLYDMLLGNDDLVSQIEPTKQGLRAMLMGELKFAVTPTTSEVLMA